MWDSIYFQAEFIHLSLCTNSNINSISKRLEGITGKYAGGGCTNIQDDSKRRTEFRTSVIQKDGLNLIRLYGM